MFIKPDDQEQRKLLSERWVSDKKSELVFLKKLKDKTLEIPVKVNQAEIFLFPGQIGLFSIDISIDEPSVSAEAYNDLIFLCRQFDKPVIYQSNGQNIESHWHDWISQHVLCGLKLRGPHIKSDEYSGSKFKVFSVFDTDNSPQERLHLLYDMATASKIGSSAGSEENSPHPEYYNTIMKNKMSVFNNWDTLSLFDSFTCVGTNVIDQPWKRSTWDYTYFRIYLYRLFFKYNLFRYNSELYNKTTKLRDQFEGFLNDYNISHISYNFLPNDMYEKIGNALNLKDEVDFFQQRINRISTAIQEEKQSRTNTLLQVVTVLGGISSVQPVLDGIESARGYMHFSGLLFYSLLALLLMIVGYFILNFLMPDEMKQFRQKLSKWFR
jgi:hypothetical protein